MAPGGPCFDTHCHLQDARFDADRGAVLARAREASVAFMVCCGTRESDWEAVRTLSGNHPNILPMLGLHPWYAQNAQPGWLDRLAARLEAEPIGVGECGLDFALEDPDRGLQESVFRAQIRLARALNRPLSIHCRRAWERLAIIAQEEGLPSAGAVIHAFSGSAETCREMQKLGFHLGFGGSLTHPENRRAAKAVAAVAADRLVFETDAPDIPPQGLTQSEPAHIALALEAAARLRNEDVPTLAALAYKNSERIFGGLIR